ncbi:hypothetical protein DESPIG_01158 [Desulfovibrio piger ATCC 29098]|uniref:Uncharacterized protein n=1 Tax=Desulfovibrio piger ATCC 29098 TaxID=411464 RepID=B6WSV6_9BACT|nr:hypothetical protein DESPIG_01158 [Desulfovibrio piger ATCC 29098]
MMFFSDDIKTNNMKIYYTDESSCKDKIDLIQIFFSTQYYDDKTQQKYALSFLMNFTGKEITYEKIISFPFLYYQTFMIFLNA